MTTLISFYTKDWKYPQHAERLKRECEALGVPYRIDELKSTGSYLRNTCLKPKFILDCLKQLESPVLWVDVDASLLGKPDLFDGEDFKYCVTPARGETVFLSTGKEVINFFSEHSEDFALPIIQTMYDFAARPMSPDRDRTWHVGTMWFNYTPAMIEFLEKWISNTGNLSDESALEKTWQDDGWMLDTFDLPKEYFYIERKGQPVPDGTVIMHRISDSEMKKRDMPIAKRKREAGEW